MNWKINDRVRMVQTDDNTGTIISEVKPGVGADGTDRISVKWDRSGKVTDWNPDFLRPINTKACDDPDEVIIGGTGRRRAKVYTDSQGTTIIIPEGFFRVKPNDVPNGP